MPNLIPKLSYCRFVACRFCPICHTLQCSNKTVNIYYLSTLNNIFAHSLCRVANI